MSHLDVGCAKFVTGRLSGGTISSKSRDPMVTFKTIPAQEHNRGESTCRRSGRPAANKCTIQEFIYFVMRISTCYEATQAVAVDLEANSGTIDLSKLTSFCFNSNWISHMAATQHDRALTLCEEKCKQCTEQENF